MARLAHTENERIYEYDTLGQYTIGAFDIYMKGNVDSDISSLSRRDLGTFVHEYVHFLQNITTLYGIYEGIIRNNAIAEMIKSFKDLSEIHIPYRYNEDTFQRDFRAFLAETEGTAKLDIEIDRDRDVELRIETLSNFRKPVKRVHFKCYTTEREYVDIIIGATIIMEYMAVLCQSLVEPDLPEHPDVPYNVISVLCDKKFPNVANDKKKLIYLCYYALFDLNPAYMLIDELKVANVYPSMSGIDIFHKNMASAISYQGKEMSVKDFYNFMLDNYKLSIQKLLGGIPEYLNLVLERVKMNDDIPPIITILEAHQFDEELIQMLIDYLGVPYVHNLDMTLTSKVDKDPKKSLAMMLPSMITSMHAYLLGGINGWGYSCPFSMTCEKACTICDLRPWEMKDCLFEVGLGLMKLDGMKIIG